MELRAARWARSLAVFVLVLFWASAAHAQRVPDEFLWFAGTAVFAPFAAVPVKMGILRLVSLKAEVSRLWWTSAIEWVLWFPAAFVMLRSIRPSEVPVTLLGLLFAATWLHKVRFAEARWSTALYLALPTPILAIGLPFLAFALAAYLESITR
jgi:hypothetical protein